MNRDNLNSRSLSTQLAMIVSVFRLLPKKMCYFAANCPVTFSLQYIFDFMKLTSYELQHGISNAPEDCVSSMLLLRKKEESFYKRGLVKKR